MIYAPQCFYFVSDRFVVEQFEFSLPVFELVSPPIAFPPDSLGRRFEKLGNHHGTRNFLIMMLNNRQMS